MKKKRLLITGVSGLLGSNLAYCLKGYYDILGIYHHQPVSIQGIETKGVDLCDKSHVQRIVAKFGPDVVIHAAAQANVDACEENPPLAYETNVHATDILATSLKQSSAKFVYISTDLVYEGSKGNFSENDSTGPRNHYASTKLEGEKMALLRKSSLSLRTNFFGWGILTRRSLAQWVIEELQAGHAIRGFTDVIFSSIYTFDLANLVHHSIEKDLAGKYNCASKSALSKYDFLVAVARGAGLDSSLIQPVFVDTAGLKASRSKNLSLDVSKLSRDLGMDIPTAQESIDHFVRDIPGNYREKIIER